MFDRYSREITITSVKGIKKKIQSQKEWIKYEGQRE